MPEDEPRIKPIAAIVSDDAREEKSGKLLLLGVYTGEIVLSSVPAQLAMSVTIIFEVPKPGQIPIEVQIKPPDSQTGIVIGGKIEAKKPTSQHQTSSLSTPAFYIPISTAGDLIISIRHTGDDEWKILRIIPVVVNPTHPAFPSILHAPSAPAQPA